MLPLNILPQIPPAAAKVYLVLLSCHSQQFPERTTLLSVSAPLATISHLAGLSPSACKEAIRTLRQLQLLRAQPGRYHAPNTYFFLDPSTPSSESLPADSRPSGPLPATDSRPAGPLPATDGRHAAPLASQTRVFTDETPISHPAGPQSNPTAAPLQTAATPAPSAAQPAGGGGAGGIQALREILSQLTPDEKSLALALAHARLASKQCQEAHI